MDEMIRYIFGTLRNSETALQSVAKNLRKQGSFNRSVTFLGTMMTLHLTIQQPEIHIIHRDREYWQKKIKDLKNREGDYQT